MSMTGLNKGARYEVGPAPYYARDYQDLDVTMVLGTSHDWIVWEVTALEKTTIKRAVCRCADGPNLDPISLAMWIADGLNEQGAKNEGRQESPSDRKERAGA